jgi:Tol biopolymer transport system component
LFDVQVNNNETHLKSIPVTGGEVRIISKFNKGYTPLLHKKLALSPDGKYIYFSITGTENGSALWRISAETGSTEKIWESKNRITGINIHPDGNQMAISVLDYGLEIRVMENLVQELEKLDKMPK